MDPQRPVSAQSETAETEERGRFGEMRDAIAARPTLNLVYRIAVAVVGTVVLVLGIVLIPYPGPGWVIVFAGLGILASEFEFAHRVLSKVKVWYGQFMDWFSKQSLVVRGLSLLLTAAVVVVTLWLLGTFALVGGWFGFDQAWLQSPISG